jgi:hypothetical protein
MSSNYIKYNTILKAKSSVVLLSDESGGVPIRFHENLLTSLLLSEPTNDSASNSSPDRAYPSSSRDTV